MKPTIDIIIPTIPPRQHTLLPQAITSIEQQTHPYRYIHIIADEHHQGAGWARNQGLDRAIYHPDGPPDLVAYLDDDDFWHTNHLQTHAGLHAQGADISYSWFTGVDPFPQHRGRPFNPDDPHHTTMAIVVARWVARQVRFRTDHPEGWILAQEDWRYILDCRDVGAKFLGTGEITWHYRGHAGNTSGMGSRW